MLHKVMVKKLGMALLAVSASALLSGCLVDKKKPEDVVKIDRKTDTLRIYQAGEWIDYNVTAIFNTIDSTTFRYGILRVVWSNPSMTLRDPIHNTDISPVLKETTTLTYNDNTDPTNPDAISVRYISQVTTPPVDTSEPGLGSIILRAIDDEIDADYWPYDPDYVGTPDSDVISPVIFKSPLILLSDSLSQNFSIMECSSNQCSNEVYTFSGIANIDSDATEVTTNLGIFSNPFRVSFNGTTTPGVGASAVEFLGDIRDICGTTIDSTTHNGYMSVVPEIGIIQMNSLCIKSGESVRLIVTARDTSFSF